MFQLCTYGIDLSYQLDGALRTPITRVLRDTRDKLIDAIKIKAAEDKWIPMSLRSKSGMARCLQECNEMGLKLEEYVTGCKSSVVTNVISNFTFYRRLLATNNFQCFCFYKITFISFGRLFKIENF